MSTIIIIRRDANNQVTVSTVAHDSTDAALAEALRAAADQLDPPQS